MSKKIILTEKQIKECVDLYSKGNIGLRKLADKYGVSRHVIRNMITENGGKIDKIGGKWKGGRKEASKRYNSKPEVKQQKKENHKKWSEENQQHLNDYHKQWRDNNREKVREGRRLDQKERMKDPIYKLNQYLKTALWAGLKWNDVNKYISTWDLLPFTLEELTIHLESLFTKGMTWSNYGEWHVDHIIPQDSLKYDFVEDKNFIKCWSLSNLRPMWGTSRTIDGVFYEGNLNKGNKI